MGRGVATLLESYCCKIAGYVGSVRNSHRKVVNNNRVGKIVVVQIVDEGKEYSEVAGHFTVVCVVGFGTV